ncbi:MULTISPECIES: DUF2231 domain-containing protein [unclassified Microbacterium]|jgi:uncharacterized membrane protein|uniref:DUF2231 domain-containing protein n=1 Tax=unclassified Microbacterium TaxID=2609290 RepID=UPI000B93C268|nr:MULTISPECIES: DUF2231 domain-containing protein [unclassified Microbacterium]MDF2580452.1 hypothetical protein [Microbacterium sp.]OYC98156.1 hypothetical protein CI089_06540 [Microbacterium sp. Yaish 1]RKE64693.1 putative membrane protein [Microbacterium sp. AG238]
MTDLDTRPDKRPANPLAGPYGHPFHPIAVTIPIGAWIASFVFDIIGLIVADPTPYAVGSRVLIGIGLVGSLVAIVLGIFDYLRIPDRTRSSSTATIHMGLNFVVCGAYLFQLFLRTSTDDIPIAGVIFSAVSLLTLSASGWLGGKLAYRYGVRVAHESKQAEGFVTRRSRR